MVDDMNNSEPSVHRIGEISAATGMTIRTLHYYEEIGLIPTTARTAAGHRLYGPDALERLYRIAFLRQLGLPLDGVRARTGSQRRTGYGTGSSICSTHSIRTSQATRPPPATSSMSWRT